MISRLVCKLKGEHDRNPTSPMFSDGWTWECARCGKTGEVVR